MIIKVKNFTAEYKEKALIALEFYDKYMNFVFKKDFYYIAMPKEHTYKITDTSETEFTLDIIQWPAEDTELGKKIFMFDYENQIC